MTLQTKVNPKDGLTYVWIPPGSFTMVSRPAEDDESVQARLNDANGPAILHNLHTEEGPVFVEDWPLLSYRPIAHSVILTRGFWMAQTPVTQEAYERVMGVNPSEFKNPRLPVDSASWNDAKKYCDAVGMRLPTEAEWEYAAWGGSTDKHDPNDINQIAWHEGNSFTANSEMARMRPQWRSQVVGQKQANGSSLHDMMGNVWEWIDDCFWTEREPESSLHDLYNLPPAMREDVNDPHRPAIGISRVLRGGSYLTPAAYIGPSSRRVMGADARASDAGFRCVGDF